ncbi:hypothetical protein [Cryobacterium sp. Y82]|uniref:hypothetical protein n=1 Tax=Cryobacterium sp. Y82 TaxID=2045017 RepID=UPI0011B04F36|nr:hypothetical protein [Cryobacterium sp. Y82]
MISIGQQEFEECCYVVTRKGSAFSEEVVSDFETAMGRHGLRSIYKLTAVMPWDTLGRLVSRFHMRPLKLRREKTAAVIGLMGLAERQLLPSIIRYDLTPYIWDCWPDREVDWRSFFMRYSPKRVAFTSRDAARYWSSQLPHVDVVWLPEAIDADVYEAGPLLSARSILLLEVGRRYGDAHDVARRTITSLGAKHLYVQPDATLTFLPERKDLIRTLHTSRALFCFPGAISHPKGRTGAWESMTHRYLEAAATKTLIIGTIPNEMIELFGFCPGLNVTLEDLPALLLQLHQSPQEFQWLVDKTHARLLEVATWTVRVSQLSAFAKRGSTALTAC